MPDDMHKTIHSSGNHTPLPWSTKRGNVGGDHPLFIQAPNGRDGLRPWSDGDARFIVLAANSHYDLLAALKDSLLLFAKDHALDRMNWGASGLRAEDIRELNELPLRIRAAIAKAEGRS